MDPRIQAGKHNPATGGFPSALHGKEPGLDATPPPPRRPTYFPPPRRTGEMGPGFAP